MKSFNLNANAIFLMFALAGAVLTLLIKIFVPVESSFISTMVVCVILLIAFHGFCYFVITQDRFRNLGEGRKLTESAVVDSCYYLGFTFTLIILISSFVNLDLETQSTSVSFNGNLNVLLDILNRFCVGLFSTGYGLVARIHLSNLIEIEQLDPEGLQEKLNIKFVTLISVMEQGIRGISGAVEESNRNIAQSIEIATGAMASNIVDLRSETKDLSKQLRSLAKKVELEKDAFEFSVATQAVKDHLFASVERITELNIVIVAMQKQLVATDAVAAKLGDSLMGSLQKISDRYDAILVQLSGFGTAVNQLGATFQNASTTTAGFTTATMQGAQSINVFRQQSDSAVERMREITANVPILGSAISTLSDELGKFAPIISQIKLKTDNSSAELVTSFSSVTNGLQGRIGALNETLATLSASLRSLDQAISALNREALQGVKAAQ